jgi:7-cyano-7-deazaguanine synthase in queuosine biosynthesis
MSSEMEFDLDLTDAGMYGFKGLSVAARTSDSVKYFLDDSLLGPYTRQLPAQGADLVDIASAVSWADRRHRRTRSYGVFGDSLGWMRTFHVKLGVREPDLWNSQEVKSFLERYLRWHTEDTWDLQFERLKGIRRPSDVAVQTALFKAPPENAVVVLFSGGLDSLAGTADMLQADPDRTLFLLSAVHSRLSGVTSYLYDRICAQGYRVKYAPFPFHLVNPRTSHDVLPGARKEEKSQRTRGFLFMAFAAATAVVTDATEVASCETGVGAVNLPVNWAQLGTQTTRAVHPRSLVDMNRLLRLIGIPDITFTAPYFWRTKAELCSALAKTDLRDLCANTVSCDNFTHRKKNPGPHMELHCGTCTSCIFRRISVLASKLCSADPTTLYETDLWRPLPKAELKPLEPAKMMNDQTITILQALASPVPRRSMLMAFPELSAAARALEEIPDIFGVPEHGDSIDRLCSLYQRYANEWSAHKPALWPA